MSQVTIMPSSPVSQRLQQIFFPCILCVLTLAFYTQVLSCGFIEAFDDEVYVNLNPFVVQGVTWQGLRWSLTTFATGNWHPLTWWSHMIDVALFNLNPTGHHATSLIIHTVNTLLLYFLFFRITGLRARSFLVAALFSLHPLHVESVAWIAERKDVLSSLFGLGALHAYISYIRSQRRTCYLAMFILFCLSLMAKPMLVTFPFLLLVLDYWPLERIRRQSLYCLLREKIPLLFPVVAISVVAILAQKSVGALTPFVNDSFFVRLSVALNAYVVYLRKFFAPYDLASYYPYTAVPVARVIVALVVLSAISVIVWRLHRHKPWLLTGWLWYLGMLVPVIGLVRVGAQSYADRYTYLPIIGVIVIVVWGGADLFGRVNRGGHVKTVVVVAMLLACAVITRKQTGFWTDGFSLYSLEIAITKGNWHAHLGLGNMLVNRNRYKEGIIHYYTALADNPRSVDAHHNLGVAFERAGDASSAQTHFQAAIKLRPDSEDNYLSLVRTLDMKDDVEGALRVIMEGLRNVPSSPSLHANKALTLQRLGRIEEAIAAYQHALNLEPGFVPIYAPLGSLLVQSGRMSEFRELLDRLNRINPMEAQRLSQLSFNRSP